MDKVWIVGSGLWANRIEFSLRSYSNFQIKRTSARTFKHIYSDIHGDDIVWIASRPGLQIDIIRELKDFFPGNVILEKPYAIDTDSYEFLKVLITSNPKIHLSTPWLYSSLWECLLQLIGENEIWSLHGERAGNVLRTYINPIEDRLPHEIYLLQNLFQQQKFYVGQRNSLDLKFQFLRYRTSGILTSNAIPLTIKIGFCETNNSNWEIRGETKEIKIDFQKHEIEYGNQMFSFCKFRNQSIPKMVSAIKSERKVSCDQIAVLDQLCKLTA